LGLAGAHHALLGAVVASADGSQVVLTGHLAPSSQGWLNDHAVGGVVLFAGAGFVELAIRAGDEVGCGSVDELNLHAPLMLSSAGADVQVIVGAGSDSGTRSFSVFSSAGEGAEWTLHAEGVLSAAAPAAPADLSVWPPAGATPVDVADAYGVLNGRGYEYGPAFQGLRAMWRRGDEIFAEVAVPEAGGSVGGFGVHPALLDSALHAVVLAAGDDGQIALPFSWQGVTLHAAGASAARARIAPTGPHSMNI
jgi:acyl transferase domain-containing protein